MGSGALDFRRRGAHSGSEKGAASRAKAMKEEKEERAQSISAPQREERRYIPGRKDASHRGEKKGFVLCCQ